MKRVTLDPNSVIALIGTAVLATGLALIYPPAAFITVGCLLIVYAILPDRGGNSA